MQTLDIRLTANLLAPQEARARLDDLGESLQTAQIATLRLLICELVTNSVLHSGTEGESTIKLHVEVSGELVRAEVSDTGSGFDVSQDRASESWGLIIVEKLADRWGAERHEESNIVWFEMDIQRR